MKTMTCALALAAMIGTGGAALAHSGHNHNHDSAAEQIHRGYFEDEQIADRALTDWAGEWQSVYPLLVDGTLDPVWVHKAEHGDKSAEEYRDYYNTGYATDVDAITIDAGSVTFTRDGGSVTGQYAADGYEVLTYAKGNRGVRFVFRKTAGDDEAPGFIQFSDHRIAPEEADHFHLYWGDDRAALLEELTNWPTYYPADLTPEQVAREMVAH